MRGEHTIMASRHQSSHAHEYVSEQIVLVEKGFYRNRYG